MSRYKNIKIIHQAIDLAIYFACIVFLLTVVVIFLNRDLRWNIIGHFYHKVLFRQNEKVVEDRSAYVTEVVAGKCGCPYCCSGAQN